MPVCLPGCRATIELQNKPHCSSAFVRYCRRPQPHDRDKQHHIRCAKTDPHSGGCTKRHLSVEAISSIYNILDLAKDAFSTLLSCSASTVATLAEIRRSWPLRDAATTVSTKCAQQSNRQQSTASQYQLAQTPISSSLPPSKLSVEPQQRANHAGHNRTGLSTRTTLAASASTRR